ncbi:hypothetical protein K439DRAFT_1663634 [Ramaria rubella]|nr:hypothetical protein K439DRAFT_1663634 [Ramaria rubella]
MKELLHIHASTSYLAAHIFNALQPNTTNDDSSIVDNGVSFRQGFAQDGSSTFRPRALLFDYKSNSTPGYNFSYIILTLPTILDKFGSLSHINPLYEGEDDPSTDQTWEGPLIEYRQDPIPQSFYHAQLDAGEESDKEADVETSFDRDLPIHDLTHSVRFWSDFSHVFYHPRGLHRMPDSAEWEREIGWAQGVERYKLYDADHMVLEDSFRLFAEECDLLQGVQLCLDAPSFGSFVISLLTQLRDEYPKLSLLSLCSLSSYDPAQVNLDDAQACMAALNDASTLHELGTLSTLTVPLQHPSTWQRGLWSKHVSADFAKPYHSSAILAAHVENATLPLRLKSVSSSSLDLSTLCAQLNWRGDTPFTALSGALPMPSLPSELELCTFDFSHPFSLHNNKSRLPLAQRDVFRGLDSREEAMVRKWGGEAQSVLQEPSLITSYIAMPYPIPSSHPQFFTLLNSAGRKVISPSPTRVRSLPLYTSLRTTPRTGAFVGSYARLVENLLIRRGVNVLQELGVEREGVAEMREAFWGWNEAYGEEQGDDDGERGEDTE